jgi:hypothetical protein
MKFLVALILIILLSFAGGLFFPWWFIAVATFIVAVVIPLRPWVAFVCGFTALFLSWGAQAMYIDAQNAHVLATRIASMLPLGGSYMALIWTTALIGGLVAGMAALTGSYLSMLIRHSRSDPTNEVTLADNK